jgi:hypothetical protein
MSATKLDRAMELLRAIEFVPIYNGGESPLSCLFCGAAAHTDDEPAPKHAPDCRLAALLTDSDQ